MRRYRLKYALLYLCFIFCFILSSCKDFIEQDISKSTILVDAPANNKVSAIYSQLFWWEALNGALKYNLQIASPSFDSITTIIDTTITTLKITKALVPGKYQWRIRALNGNYKTQFQTYNLTIIAGALSAQVVTLDNPANGVYQKTSPFSFKWEPVYGATKYLIEIDNVTGNFISPLVLDSFATNNFFTYPVSTEGDYMWRVKAKDDAGHSTAWSTVYYTGYYVTKPATPLPTAPANNATAQISPVQFSWNGVTKAASYNLYVYPTGDTVSTAPTIYSAITATNKMVTIPSSRTVFWRISSVDKAGNESLLTIPARKFTTQ